MELRIALQVGAMKPAMMQLFKDAYLPIQQKSEASFDGIVHMPEYELKIRFMKSSNIPEAIVSKEYIAGITGQDVIYQARKEEKVEILQELPLSRQSNKPTRIVLVALERAEFTKEATIFCDREYSRLAEEFIQAHPVLNQNQTCLSLQDGNSEERVQKSNHFAIIAMETGTTLRSNSLKVFNTLMESQMVLFVRKGDLQAKGRNIEEIGWLLRGMIEARPRVLLKMNVLDDDDLKPVLSHLPALGSPTEMPLKDGGNALEAVVFSGQVADLIPRLKRAGASGILLQDLKMVVL